MNLYYINKYLIFCVKNLCSNIVQLKIVDSNFLKIPLNLLV